MSRMIWGHFRLLFFDDSLTIWFSLGEKRVSLVLAVGHRLSLHCVVNGDSRDATGKNLCPLITWWSHFERKGREREKKQTVRIYGIKRILSIYISVYVMGIFHYKHSSCLTKISLGPFHFLNSFTFFLTCKTKKVMLRWWWWGEFCEKIFTCKRFL